MSTLPFTHLAGRRERAAAAIGLAGLLLLPWAAADAVALPADRLGAAGARPTAGPTSSDADPAAAAGFEATVTAYLLSPDAEVGGLLFDDGRQLRVPPHLGAKLAAIVHPGQRVRLGARPGSDASGPGRMPTITVVDTGKTLRDDKGGGDGGGGARDGADPPPLRPPVAEGPRAALSPFKVSGVVKQLLAGQRGETNGLVLDNGTQVSFPPHVAGQAGGWLVPGTAIEVEGFGRRSAYGSAVQATVIGQARGPMVRVYGAGRPKP